MALNSCAALGYTYNKNFCLPVGVDVKREEFTYDAAWIAGAFFLGLVLGAGIILLAKPFLAAWKKWKKKDGKNLLLNKTGRTGVVVDAETANGWVNKDKITKSSTNENFKRFFTPDFWKRQKKPVLLINESKKATENDIKSPLVRGMADIILQTSRSASEKEMAEQDMGAVISMEKSTEEGKATLVHQILGILLKKKLKKKLITNNFFNYFIKKVEEDLKYRTKIIDREREEDEKRVKSDQKHNKNANNLVTDMQKLKTHYNNKQIKLQKDFKNKMRQDLLRLSGMSEPEINDILTKLINNMTVVEKKVGLEQARQRRALEQRLARRRQVLEYMEMEDNETEHDLDIRMKSFKNLLPTPVGGSLKLGRNSDKIVNEFARDLQTIKTNLAKEYSTLSKDSYDTLLKARLTSYSKLTKRQDNEKSEVLRTGENITNTIDYIQRYHNLMVKQNLEREALFEEQDHKEAQDMLKLKLNLSKKENQEIDSLVEKTAEKLQNAKHLTPSEAEKMVKLHKAEIEDYKAKRLKEKQALLVKLQEHLQQRLKTADENEARDEKEQEILKDEQMASLTKVLACNMDLTKEDKERILNEHEQNMQALSNQLMQSKLRQQKSLVIKLNQRKAQLEKLNQMKKDLQRSNVFKEKEKSDQLAKLTAEIAKEEQLFELARQAAVAELRQQLAHETEEALKIKEEEINFLIGRLQVSAARRKVTLEKEDPNLKKLLERLEGKSASGEYLPTSEFDVILKEHNKQVAYLNDQLQQQREKEEMNIREKLSVKKRQLKLEMEHQLEDHAQSEYTEQQLKGAGFASLALLELFLEQKRAKAMQEVNTMMLLEMEKCRSDFNLKLELELQKELQLQEQEFLAEIASVSKISMRDGQAAISAVGSAFSELDYLKSCELKLNCVLQRRQGRSLLTGFASVNRAINVDVLHTKL